MVKSEYLRCLRRELTHLYVPASEIEQIVAYYNEYIDDAVERGRLEWEAVAELDPPDVVAAACRSSAPPAQPYAPPAQPYTPPAQPYTPPAQPYTPPAQPYTPPAQPYTPPAQPYTPPAQPYTPPAQPYTPPAQPYTPQPQPAPAQPAQSYMPQPAPAQPAQSYMPQPAPAQPAPQPQSGGKSRFWRIFFGWLPCLFTLLLFLAVLGGGIASGVFAVATFVYGGKTLVAHMVKGAFALIGVSLLACAFGLFLFALTPLMWRFNAAVWRLVGGRQKRGKKRKLHLVRLISASISLAVAGLVIFLGAYGALGFDPAALKSYFGFWDGSKIHFDMIFSLPKEAILLLRIKK